MNKKKPNKHEKCVECGEDTEYASMSYAEARCFYVKGKGYLCQTCLDELYHATMRVNFDTRISRRTSEHGV